VEVERDLVAIDVDFTRAIDWPAEPGRFGKPQNCRARR
jgi:hypothetical protein